MFAFRHRGSNHDAQEVWSQYQLFLNLYQVIHLSPVQADRRSAVAKEITSCKDRIQRIMQKTGVFGEEDVRRARSFLNVLSVFETEIACQSKTWSRVLDVIQVMIPPRYYTRGGHLNSNYALFWGRKQAFLKTSIWGP